nr:GEVED domain-containing protein [uncultured Flavobacterium sp.]
MRKITLLITLILCGIMGANAQASLYGYSVSTENYTAITGGTQVLSATDYTPTLDSSVSTQLTLSTPFTFAGVSYTQCYVTSNGQLSFGTTSPSTSTYNILGTSFGDNAVLAPFSGDLAAGATGLAEIRTETVGDEIVFQWTNFRRYNVSESFNFQIRLNVLNGNIKYIYSGTPLFTSTTSYQPQIGLKSAVGVYKGLVSAASGTFAVPTVITSGATSSSTMALSATNTFSAGLTYTFKAPLACTGAPEGGTIAGDAVRTACSGATISALTVPVVNTSLQLAYQWQESANGTDWTDVTTGTGATTLSYTPVVFSGTTIQYRLKTTCTATNDVAYSTNTITIKPVTGPTTQATVLATTQGINQFSASWTSGNGTRRQVYVSTSPITDPVNGNYPAFTAATAFANNGQQLVYDGTGSSVTVTGVTCGTTVYVKVFEYNRCGSGPYDVYYNTTTVTNGTTVTTGPLTAAIPATNNFTGFTGSNLSTAVTGWYEASIATPAATVPANANPVVADTNWSNSTALGITTARYNLFTNTANAWIISPKMQLTADSRVKFKAAITNFNSGNVDPERMIGTDDKVTVLVSTDGCGAVWTPVYVFSADNTANLTNVLTDYSISLSAYTGQTVQIAFQATDGPADDAPDYDFHIGNIVVEVVPACESPASVAGVKTSFTTGQINWTAPIVSAPAGGYEYYRSTDAAAPGATTAASGSVGAGVLTTNLTELTANTTYYVWVRSVCDANNKSAWISGGSFFTGYCTPAPSSVDNRGILSITLGTINSTSGTKPTNYGDYTNLSTTADVASTVNFGVTYGTRYTYGTKVWVDWNNDSDFDDEGELVYTGLSTADDPTTLSGSFVVPTTALLGSHRVRIGGTDNDNGGTPCYTGTFGSYEDFTLVVVMPAVPVITSFTPDSACAESATLTITGTALANSVVKVGETTIQTTSVTATQIVATVPAGVSGVVSVTTVAGTATTTAQFAVATPAALEISASEASICIGSGTQTLNITEGATAYDTFVWTPATGITGNATNGYVFNPAETTTYTLTASQSAGPCITATTFTVTVNALPTAVTVVPATSSVCEGSIVALTATGGINTKQAVIGTGTTAPADISYPNPFSAYYGGVKTQILYTATELEAMGVLPGSVINSLSFDFFASVARELNDFRIKIGATTVENTTAGFVASSDLTTVYNASYTPVVGTTGWVPFALTTPYVYTGGNLIIEIAHNAGNSGNGSGTRTRTTTTTANSVYYGAKDTVAPAGMASYDALTSYTSQAASTSRPNITFAFETPRTVTWSPVTNLYTDAQATVPYVTGADARTVYVKATATTPYVATSTNLQGCTAVGTATVTVNSVAAPVVPATLTVCVGATVAQLTATGENIQWYTAQTGGQPLATTALLESRTYYATQTVNGCTNVTRAAVAVTVNVVEVSELDDVTACGSYTLPALNAGAYYSATGGQGVLLHAGDPVTTNRTIYIYAQSGDCSAETSFTVTITTLDTPVVEDVTACNSYTLPQLNAGSYYIEPNGVGNPVPAGTTYSDSTTLYVFVREGNCTAEASFDITINYTPVLTAVSPQVVTTQNDVATIEDIVVTADGPVQWYASEADYANNNPLPAGTQISPNTTYFAGQSNGTCSAVITVEVSEVLGDKGFDLAKFSYYPNPVNSELNIAYSSEITSVAVFNMLGQNVLNVKPNAATTKVNMSALAEGTYIVNVTAGSVSKTIKVVKK